MKNKGFVLIETIIIICVLCVGLLSIYKSYSSLIGRINNDNKNKNIENDYKAEYIAKRMLYNNVSNEDFSYIELTASDKKICNTTGCQASTLEENDSLIINSFDTLNIEKIYYTKNDLTEFINTSSILLTFDGTTITYLNSIKNSTDEERNIVLNVIVKTKDKTFGYYQLDDKYRDIGTVSVSDEEIFAKSTADFVLKTIVDGGLTNEFPKSNKYSVDLLCKDTLKNEVRNIGKIIWNGTKWEFSVSGITDTGTVCRVKFICNDVTKIGNCEG